MDAGEVQRRLLAHYGLRVEPETSQYVLRRVMAGTIDAIPVMGGDARTGIPVRQHVDPALLQGSSTDVASSRGTL